MRIGLACDGGPLAADLLGLLAAAGLAAGPLRTAASPALVTAGDDSWMLGPGRDVAACCERGAVDAAVLGKELLLELEPDVAELLDLRVRRDRLVYAIPSGGSRRTRPRPRVATRFPKLTRRHFAASGRQIETLPLGEAAILTPELGLADGVVELEGRLPGLPGFVVSEELVVCSARLVAAPAARVLSAERLSDLTARLRDLVEDDS